MDDCQSGLLLRKKIEEIKKANVLILENNSILFRASSKWRVPFSPFVQIQLFIGPRFLCQAQRVFL